MTTRRLLPLLAAGTLLLTGCSGDAETTTHESAHTSVQIETVEPQSEWEDDDQKLRVFMDHVCWRDGHESTLEPHTHATTAAVGVMADPASTPEDEKIALSIITRPADAYEQDVAWAEAAGEEVPEDTVPRTLTPEGEGSCSGWVWEKHLEQAYEKEYADFTFEKARSEGAI